ncbi:hypothetical protein PGT21_023608 [Puccinia graminis f. sp. tritici]|uniref:RING-type domain-containing protein n=1 Tax=Puccinia graminis f. sp. tritici TaxID=56615 RepID=A0A5B0MS17_PUCGR|nr:hypothetical protein PGT21_023608 [Puccinia graminis f. sp. tritici]
MRLLVTSLRLIVLFQVSNFIYGLPFEHGASSSSSYNLRRICQSCKSIKHKLTHTVRSGVRRLNRFGSTSAGPHEAGVCSICSSSISDRQQAIKWPTCIEGHTAHKDCVDPRNIEESSCPCCQPATPSIQKQVEHRDTFEPEQLKVCSICLEEFDIEDVRMKWPSCAHPFHQDCVEKWRETRVTCPLCRSEDEKLSKERAEFEAQRREEERSHGIINGVPLFGHFLRRLSEIGSPRNEQEAAEIADLRLFFQRREEQTQSNLQALDQAEIPTRNQQQTTLMNPYEHFFQRRCVIYVHNHQTD